MAYSFLIFDFDGSEDVAQQARHRIEGWKQAFRLDKKVQLKFDRKGADANQGNASESSSSSKTAKSGSVKASEIRMIVRLDFSDHEKLSHQRWLERIPTEEPFKAAKPKVVRAGDPEFETTAQLFDVLDPAARKNYSPA